MEDSEKMHGILIIYSGVIDNTMKLHTIIYIAATSAFVGVCIWYYNSKRVNHFAAININSQKECYKLCSTDCQKSCSKNPISAIDYSTLESCIKVCEGGIASCKRKCEGCSSCA